MFEVLEENMNRILVDCSTHQINIGVVEEGELVEYFVENKQNKRAVRQYGNVHSRHLIQTKFRISGLFFLLLSKKNRHKSHRIQKACRNAKEKDPITK